MDFANLDWQKTARSSHSRWATIDPLLSVKTGRNRPGCSGAKRSQHVSLSDVINLVDPQSHRRAAESVAEKIPRRPRQLKQYKNPHNGEVIETKDGNHKLLKQWKAGCVN
ncbi:TPA: histone-like nucleoid-structuring protein, MvaT/MvaU family [Pseudomonas aeruginosa]